MPPQYSRANEKILDRIWHWPVRRLAFGADWPETGRESLEEGAFVEMPLYERTSDGNCRVLGLRMCQNRLAVAVLSYVIETGGFKQVIELGTQLGGLSALLGLQCRMVRARFDTFDKEAASPYAG